MQSWLCAQEGHALKVSPANTHLGAACLPWHVQVSSLPVSLLGFCFQPVSVGDFFHCSLGREAQGLFHQPHSDLSDGVLLISAPGQTSCGSGSFVDSSTLNPKPLKGTTMARRLHRLLSTHPILSCSSCT